MEILQKYEKLWNLDGKVIPDFVLTEPAPDILFDDVHWNITKYLGKIYGLLNKKLRQLWREIEGFSVRYDALSHIIKLDPSYVTEIYIDCVKKIQIGLFPKFTRLEKIFIDEFEDIFDEKPQLEKLLNIFVDNKENKYKNFKGIFFNSRCKCFKSVQNANNSHQIVKYYIFYIGLLSYRRQKYIFVSTEISRNKIYAGIEDYKKYDNLLSEKNNRLLYGDHCFNKLDKIDILKYCQLENFFVRLALNPEITKERKLKVIIVEDSNTLSYYYNVLKPAYNDIGIELELLMVGCLYKKISDLNGRRSAQIHLDEGIYRYTFETGFKFDLAAVTAFWSGLRYEK